MTSCKIRALVTAAALSTGAAAIPGAAYGGPHDGVWHGGGWPGHHGFRGIGDWGWGGSAPFVSSAGNCVQRQWVSTPYGWRLEWVDVCSYGW